MSVINQALSDLEKRGAATLPGGPSVRVVPQKKNFWPALLLAAALVLALVLALQWHGSAQPKHVAPIAGGTVQSGTTIPAPSSAVALTATATLPPKAEPQPTPATPTQKDTATLPASEQKAAGATALPAMRMSFELSSIPLPSSLRPQTVPQRPMPGEPTSLPAPSLARAQAKAAPPPPPQPAAPQRNSAPPPENAVPGAATAGGVDKQIKQLSVQQQADNEFRKANGLLQQGRIGEALASYEAALRLDPGHDAARQALTGLLLENKRSADAEKILQDGLAHNPRHSGFAMLLARIQIERDAAQAALDTLLKTLPHAEQQADYRAFTAALLQRLGRHQEAIAHYQAALQLTPGSGIWLMGLGISQQALQHNEEAREAYRRALESHSLNTELQAFVRQRLKEL